MNRRVGKIPKFNERGVRINLGGRNLSNGFKWLHKDEENNSRFS